MQLDPEDRSIYLCLAALSGIAGWLLSYATGLSVIATLPICSAIFLVGGHFALRRYIDRTVATAVSMSSPVSTLEIQGIGTLLDFRDYWQLKLDTPYLVDDIDATMCLDKCGPFPHPSQLDLATSFWAHYVEKRDYLTGVLADYLSQSDSEFTVEDYATDCDSVDICCPDSEHQFVLTYNLRDPTDGFTSVSLRDWVAIEVESGD